MATLPENMSVAIDELEAAITEMESRLESAHAERDEAKARQVELEIENANLRRELALARERQNASAEILAAIANTDGDAEHALQQIAETARHFFDASSVTIRITDGKEWIRTIRVGRGSERVMAAVPARELAVDGKNVAGLVYRENRQIHVPDLDHIDASIADFPGWAPARAGGSRTVSGTPLRLGAGAIGAMIIHRDLLAAFTDEELALQQSFADQAVIAIENARLFNETQQALERQTATADVLKVIASSPSDVQPVFAAIASSAKRLLDGFTATVLHFRGDQLHLVAFTPSNPEADEGLQASFPQPVAEFQIFALVRDGATIQFPDTEADGVPAMNRDLGRLRGFRSVLFVPLMNQGKAVGILSVTRTEPGAFADHHVQLLQTFADQAVIAIENTRLFNETQEALERQTATADILKVIASSPSDTTPVFEAIASSAKRLLGGFSASVFRFVDGSVYLRAFTPTNPAADESFLATFPRPVADFEPFRLVQHGQPMIPDTEDISNEQIKEIARQRGFRSMLFVPLMNGGIPIGIISVTRLETGSYAAHHVELLQTFADQAVIAIENTRLFNETQEALERQTATADILKVIASSPSDTTPVFEAIVASAKRLLGGFSSASWRFADGIVHLAAFTPTNPAADDALRADFPRPIEEFLVAQLVGPGEPVIIPDTEQIDDVPLKATARIHGFRSALFVPLLNGGVPIGTLSVTRTEPGAFADHHVRLLQTFADQAVIAIENTRLFNETQEALERQTATADILKVIASSPADVQPVLEAIANSAAQLFAPHTISIQRLIDGEFHWRAIAAADPNVDVERIKANYPIPFDPERSPSARAILEHRIVEISDVEAPDAPELTSKIGAAGGFRHAMYVPLLSQGEGIGSIILTHPQPGLSLSKSQLALLQTFADQAVIAIENTRLFNETQEALERQTATAEILKVIASSPSDTSPVFEAIASSAKRLLDAFSAAVFRFLDGKVHLAALTAVHPIADEAGRADFPRPVDDFPPFRQAQHGEPFAIPDTEQTPHEGIRQVARLHGFRSMLYVPLMSGSVPIGIITATRAEPGAFAPHHVQLLQTFADQAVIAIENTRLFNETKEALERQTATADILKVIASSPSDVQPVFDTIVHSANRLIGGFSTAVFRYGDGKIHLAAFTPTDTEGDAFLQSSFPVPLEQFPPYQLTREGAPAELPDTETEPAARDIARARGYRSMLFAPLMNEGKAVGIITVTRIASGPFGEQHTRLLQMFADQAVIAIRNVGLFNEVQQRTEDLSEALQQQTATADVLKVISRSAFDLETVLDALLSSACRLCEADIGTIRYREGGEYRLAATFGFRPEWIELFKTYSTAPERSSVFGRTIIEGRTVHIPDLLADPDYDRPEAQKLMGFQAAIGVPLTREGEVFGVITLFRFNVGKFEDRQIELVQTFADQAVIAIENVRLFDEVQAKTRDLEEALTYQTGSANILRVIASSPTDVAPVLDAIASSACELCDASDALVFLKEGDRLGCRAHHGPIPVVFTDTRPINRGYVAGRTVIDKVPVHVTDIFSEEGADFPEARELSRSENIRSILCVPMLREGESVGAILLRRTEVNPFSDKQLSLLQTFADQAVIAIGNVRLFEEVQTRTHELAESLEQQTATSEVLSVISRSAGDLAPVFDAMLSKAMQLCSANFGVLNTYDGARFHTAATYGLPPGYDEFRRRRPLEYGPATAPTRLLEGEPFVEIPDLLESEAYRNGEPNRRALVDLGGARCLLAVPLLKDGRVVGNVMIFRQENRQFSEKQITLLQQFAAQAVIAIENARLLNELRQRTDDLAESLQFQTASSEVLKVISSSPDALQPVLDAIAQTSHQLCGSDNATIVLFRDRKAEFAAVAGVLPAHYEFLRSNPASIDEPGSLFDRMIRQKRTLHFPNVMDDPEISQKPRTAMGGPRALLVTPLLRDGEPVGAIVLRQSHLKPFTPRQIQAIEVFADQAVIAISNVELFEQVQQRTRELSESLQQQTATADVLQVISASPGDLAPVFEKMLENAVRVCGAGFGSMNLVEDGVLRQAALYNVPAEFAAARANKVFAPHPTGALAEAISTKQVVHVADVRTGPAYLERFPATVELVELGGARTVVNVPMLRDDEMIGAIIIYRNEVRPFSDKQIELLSNFAKQAVIAIENARLLKELRQRTSDLSQSLDDLRTAQGRLVQTEKLASLGQLTAGIAHEIKNPLNFVNNFAALSAELTQELNEVLKPAGIGDKMRAEVNELTGLLKDNLEKVVQHGKRADSIVKNMLLHSREGGGEHRPSDINALVDESLNLAYHGARAEKPGFNVTLEHDFDPAAGQIDLFPQEITRVFLNLISNGFYAVTKRSKDGAPGFEPTVRASTKNLGESVEIRIRDNGTGIPPEVKEKMFNPFFTTKPAGEGTGLGLSMSHDIIVKQHGGTIDVDTSPGDFTEFRIVLPRTSNFADKSRG